jgi:GT2 family glycosyltransferase
VTAADGAPDVTVVTVTYQAHDLVLACLDSLARQDLGPVRMRVVVVDNASTDGTPELVERGHPEVDLVRSGSNLGFAGGNNLALRGVRSRYALLLNNDATADPQAVRRLVEAMDAARPEVAALAATVLLAGTFRAAGPQDAGRPDLVHGPDGTWVPDAEGTVRLVNSTGNQVRSDGFGSDRGWLAEAGAHHPPRDVFGFSGAAVLLRMAALHDVGFFDERYFMYYEDTDLSWRLRLGGYRVQHCPGAVVHHLHSASAGEGSELARFHDVRNRMCTVLKDASAPLAARVLAAHLLTTASVLLRRRQAWPLVRTRLRAQASFLRLVPSLLRSRRAISRAARTPRREVERLLVAPGAPLGPYRAPGAATRS